MCILIYLYHVRTEGCSFLEQFCLVLGQNTKSFRAWMFSFAEWTLMGLPALYLLLFELKRGYNH